MSGPVRAVVAAQDDDGTVFYEYGWARDISMDMDIDQVMGMDGRRRTHRECSTAIEWSEPPRRSATYPTDADFARPAEIETAQQALAVAPRALLTSDES